ncbi:hypothetical protein NS794_31240, partial [Pseudomonas aeruginosa]|uniref:hypothetical protein n=1 Tax=Pseudomonas aeruginosa TaxID=287 RepID=UPI001C8B9464
SFVGNIDVLDMVFEGLLHDVLLERFGSNRTVSRAGGGPQPKILGLAPVNFWWLAGLETRMDVWVYISYIFLRETADA